MSHTASAWRRADASSLGAVIVRVVGTVPLEEIRTREGFGADLVGARKSQDYVMGAKVGLHHIGSASQGYGWQCVSSYC